MIVLSLRIELLVSTYCMTFLFITNLNDPKFLNGSGKLMNTHTHFDKNKPSEQM